MGASGREPEIPAEIGALCMNGSLITWTSFRPEKRRERRAIHGATSPYGSHACTDHHHRRQHTARRSHVHARETHTCATAPTTFMHRALPAFYGLDAPASPRFTAMYTGIVSMSSFIHAPSRIPPVSHSHPPGRSVAGVSTPVCFAQPRNAATIYTGSRALVSLQSDLPACSASESTPTSRTTRGKAGPRARADGKPRSMLNEFTLR